MSAGGEDAPSPDVGEVMRARLEQASTPGARSDPYRVALVMEGGGMRGVISAGMAGAVDQLGILDAFDMVVGTSAGAVNAAALTSGVIQPFTEAYARTFTDRAFIDTRRALRGGAIVDVVKIVAHASDAFGVTRAGIAKTAGLQTVFVATSVATGEATAFTSFADDEDFASSLAASSLLPLVGGKPIVFRGDRWLDGGLTDPIPVASAAALGASHAVVLTTRPVGQAPVRSRSDVLVERYLRRLNPALADGYRTRPERYAATTRSVRQGQVGGVRTFTVSPSINSPIPSRLERDQDLLSQASQAAFDDAMSGLVGLVNVA